MSQTADILRSERAVEEGLVRLVPSTATLEVRHGDTVVASSSRVVELHEVDVPVRYYFPREDVRLDALTPVESVTYCPFKGVASDYWRLAGADHDAEPVAWSYPEPFPAFADIAGHVAFYDVLPVTVVS